MLLVRDLENLFNTIILNNCKLVTMCLSPEFVQSKAAQIQGSVRTNKIFFGH